MSDKIAVLLSTYNGENFIEEQIESVLNQRDADVTLFIRDDGSTDGTISILDRYRRNENCRIFTETNIGVIKSFFNLIQKAEGFDYYAFCDQDDVWDADKLKTAVEFLRQDTAVPAMYYSATRIVDEKLCPLKQEKDIRKVLSLKELLLSNNATGCTMVFNRVLRDAVSEAFPKRAIMHDHWLYLLCVALGGKVCYDPQPHISYRQHGNNVLGDRRTLKSILKYSSFTKLKCVRSELAELILIHFDHKMPAENKAVIEKCAKYRCNLSAKLTLLKTELPVISNFKRKVIFVIQVICGLY